MRRVEEKLTDNVDLVLSLYTSIADYRSTM